MTRTLNSATLVLLFLFRFLTIITDTVGGPSPVHNRCSPYSLLVIQEILHNSDFISFLQSNLLSVSFSS